MSTHLSKFCADFLRSEYNPVNPDKLKASHARELVAAFFGYKSHAALIADQNYHVDRLEEARILAPDIQLIDQRIEKLSGLPANLPSSWDLAKSISTYLQNHGHFGGDVWIYDSLDNYIKEVLLINEGSLIDDELSGVFAETNAVFDEPYYETASSQVIDDEVVVDVEGTYYGSTDLDKPFSGDEIDMQISVTLYRVVGRTGFSDCEISAFGNVNHDGYYDPEP